MDAAILTRFDPVVARELAPGSYLIALGDPLSLGPQYRAAGLHMRDSIAIFLPGPTFSVGLLFRKLPLEDMLLQRCPLNVDGCRVPGVPTAPWGKIRSYRVFHDRSMDGPDYVDAPSPNTSGRWPPNVVLVHSAVCRSTEDNWECLRGCPVPPLGDFAELFHQFRAPSEVVGWMEKLITPPGGSCFLGVGGSREQHELDHPRSLRGCSQDLPRRPL